MRVNIRILYFLYLLVHSELSFADIDSWQQVKDVSLIISENSPLDFSRFIEPGPAGKFGSVNTNSKGRIVLGSTKKNVSFSCASLAWSPATGGFPDHQQADLYAHQLRLYGYNLVRFHYVDAMLMSNKKVDFSFDLEQLDRWFYFLAALKREGIYWLMDGMTSSNGALGNVYPHRWIPKYNLLERVYYEEQIQEHWKEMVRKILMVKNPYTGIETIKDPALIGIVLVNENDINFLATKSSWPNIGIQKDFNVWLLKIYKTTESLGLVWKDLDNSESLEKNTIKLPKDLNHASARVADFQKYIQYKQESMIGWMTSFLHSQGFKGLVTAIHVSKFTADNLSRKSLSWIDMHNYHDGSVSWESGTAIGQTSSINNFGGYIRVLAAARSAGKPFSLTEYGQPFWNRYRYEAAPLAASMASLQDWDFVCLHASGVVDLSLQQKHKMKALILPYGGGVDPIVRAGETLSSLLMLRRDIKPSTHTIRVPFSSQTVLKKSGIGTFHDFSKLAWLSKMELTPLPLSKKNYVNESSVIYLHPTPQLRSEILPSVVNFAPRLDFMAMSYIDLLRKKKFLNATNKTSISDGVLHSDNEQVLINQKEGFFQINTSRTEAFVSNKPYNHHKINALTIENLNVDGLIAASSLDANSLTQSEKVLFIFATDAENTDMKFADSQRKKLVNIGQMPPRIRAGKVDIKMLSILNKKSFKLYSLHLNGDLGDEIPLIKYGNYISFTLDNTALTHGPTTYFLLVAK